MEIPGARLETRCTQLRVPSVEDPYVLLEIQYMIIVVLHEVAVGGSMLSLLSICYLLYLASLSSSAPPGFIYATRLGFTRVLVYYIFGLPSSWAFSILGRARYSNNGYPKGMPMTTTKE